MTVYLIGGGAALLGLFIGYKIGHFRGRRRLGAMLRQSGSIFADRV